MTLEILSWNRPELRLIVSHPCSAKIRVMAKKLLPFVVAALVAFGVWFYFGWYMSPRQIRARCWNNEWVQQAERYWGEVYHFNNCLMQHGLPTIDGNDLP